jgi:hypothetical protein
MTGVFMICMAMPGNGCRIAQEIIITVLLMMVHPGQAVQVAAGYFEVEAGTVLPIRVGFRTETGYLQISQAQVVALGWRGKNNRVTFYDNSQN